MSDPTVSTAVRPGGDASAAAPAVQHVPWDVLQIALTGLILLQVWRVHDLFRVLAFPGLPVLATAVSVGLFLLSRAVWSRVTSLNHPIARTALGLVLIAALSVPGSLYPSHSMSFLLKDYLRSVILMLLIAGSIRGLTDLRRFAWVHVLGLTVLSAVILSRASI